MATGSTKDYVSAVSAPALPAAPGLPLPRLEPGDRLSRAEFLRRYEAMPDLKKAELIEGVVHTPSPIRFDVHSHPHANVLTWLGIYAAATPGVKAGGNATVKLDNDNVPQPDALLMIEPVARGQAAIDEGGYVAGAPELVAEVSSSTVSIDLHDKLRVYRRNGVREYISWRAIERGIDWFGLRDGDYVRLSPSADGIIRSEVFPGLWLDVSAMLDGKLDRVLEVLHQGLATPEHRGFVEELAKRRSN
jgi:Uma2 family endonuclease